MRIKIGCYGGEPWCKDGNCAACVAGRERDLKEHFNEMFPEVAHYEAGKAAGIAEERARVVAWLKDILEEAGRGWLGRGLATDGPEFEAFSLLVNQFVEGIQGGEHEK